MADVERLGLTEGFLFSAQEFHKSAAKVEKFVMLENVESLREKKNLTYCDPCYAAGYVSKVRYWRR